MINFVVVCTSFLYKTQNLFSTKNVSYSFFSPVFVLGIFWKIENILSVKQFFNINFKMSLKALGALINIFRYSLTIIKHMYSVSSLIQIYNIHLSGHLFWNQSPFLNRKWLTYPEIQLSGQSVWERRCPNKWGSTVHV